MSICKQSADCTNKLAQGYGAVHLPYALAQKYPNANREWVWQFVFPSDRRCRDPRTEQVNRHHLHESDVQKALKQAVFAAKIQKRVGCQTVLPTAFIM